MGRTSFGGYLFIDEYTPLSAVGVVVVDFKTPSGVGSKLSNCCKTLGLITSHYLWAEYIVGFYTTYHSPRSCRRPR